jgi:hypothetical protein
MANLVARMVLRAVRYSPMRSWFDGIALRRWERAGRPVPPPFAVKRAAIVGLARRHNCRVLVETGTYMGDTMYGLRNSFRQLISIELHEGLHARAQRLLGRYGQLRFVRGDSAAELPVVIKEFNEPIIFWLDGHYSGPGTARGSLDSPIWQEMEAVFSHGVRDHVILIDDARKFVGQGGYPTVDELRRWVEQRRPGWVFAVEHDIIRIHPPGGD